LGLDTSKADPTGTWSLGADSFRAIGTMLRSLSLPTLVVQEGGYRTRTLGANCRNFFLGIYSSWRPARSKKGQRRNSADRKVGRLLRYSVSRLDIEPVGKMVTDTGVFSAEEVDCAKELVAEASERGEDGSGYRFVFLENGAEMMGYACFGRVPLTESSFDLYWLVVDPRYHRQGVAAELLSAVETETARLGGHAIYAETSSAVVYAPARAFYMNQGYEEASRLKDFYRPGDDRITFLKQFPKI
ncbi:MAG TPA: GNAT family N-acetyltransferase, partial [Candidatus Melainabacteria bacterium]|nr:GNAT family N-acetyltransferase [Candidatus Melainabacteria bacterium]